MLLLLVLTGAGLFWFKSKNADKPYQVGVILSEAELPAGDLEGYKFIIARKLEKINNSGGINGRKIETIYLDDNQNDDTLYSLVQQTSRNPDLIGYIGCRGLSRAIKIAPLITGKRIPLLGLYAFTDSLQANPTMYTFSIGMNEARHVLLELFKDKATKIGFIGESGNMMSEAMQHLLQEMVAATPELKITVNRLFKQPLDFSDVTQKQFADSLKTETDFLVFIAGPQSSNAVLGFLKQNKISIPAFISWADILQLDDKNPAFLGLELFGINTFSIPGAQNTRLQEELMQYNKDFKLRPNSTYQLSQAGRLADELGLIQEAANLKLLPEAAGIREKINAGLREYVNGKRIYRGWLSDWHFTPEHAYGGQTLLAWKPKNAAYQVLSATQYIRTEKTLFPAPVFYTSLNMIQIDQINEEEETFFASFYLELNALKAFDLAQIDFANAVRNEIDHKPLIEAKLIRSEMDSLKHKFHHRLYKISGRFYFEPNLKNYPLDEQKFFIILQAANAWQPFLAQPSIREKQDSVFESKGWVYKDQFVGYDQDIIVSPNAFGQTRKNIPHYKFTYAYILKRSHIDFFLKTLVPLLAILVAAYFSVYIPAREFEALAGIQVTALLSSIALYFATYKPQMPYATISDKIFIFTYIMVTSLIGTSIFIYIFYRKQNAFTAIMKFYQRILFPVLIIGFLIYMRWF